MKAWPSLCVLLFLVACSTSPEGGSGGGANPPPSIAGKWTINSTSTQGHLNSILLTDFVDQGNGTFSASQVVLCYSNPTLTCYGGFAGNGSVAIQGSVTSQGNLSMVVTSSPQGATGCSATYTGTLSSGSITATYTGCSDAGTMTATTSPSVSGTYTGQLTSGANPGLFPFGISAVLTEVSDHSLSGTAAVTNSLCFTSLTFGPPSIAVGDSVYLQDATHGVTVVTPLGTTTNVSAVSVTYTVSPTQYCGADYGTGILTKQ